MITLIKLQLAKRRKLAAGFLILMLALNVLVTGYFELYQRSLGAFAGFGILMAYSMLILFVIAIGVTLREQSNPGSRWLYLFPVGGIGRMTIKYVFLLLDMTCVVAANLVFGMLVRMAFTRDLAAGLQFFRLSMTYIWDNALWFMLFILFSYAIACFAIVLSQSVFYQNRAAIIISACIIASGVFVLITSMSECIMCLFPVMAKSVTDDTAYILIEVYSGNQWYLPNIVILVLAFLTMTIASARIMDHRLNF